MRTTIAHALLAASTAVVIAFSGTTAAQAAEITSPPTAETAPPGGAIRLPPGTYPKAEPHTMAPASEIIAVFDRINERRAAEGVAPLIYNVTIAHNTASTLNAAMSGSVAPGWNLEKNIPLGYTAFEGIGSGSFQLGLTGALEAINTRSGAQLEDLLDPRYTHVGISIGHRSNPGVYNYTTPDGRGHFKPISGTLLWAHLYSYTPGTTLPGDYQDAADAFAGYTAPATSPFTDVRPGQPFYQEMAWLAQTGISTGWDHDDGTASYRPHSTIKRDAMAAFLYRWNGAPDLPPAQRWPDGPPLTDITPATPFYTEINWVTKAGIAHGWPSPDWRSASYKPRDPITRDAMAAFLYRMAGSPDYTAPKVSPFTDVSTKQQHYKEMAWLADQGISTGWAHRDGTRSYKPTAPVTRDAMAAFLYRTAHIN